MAAPLLSDMDNPYENKQKYRKKEKNSSKGLSKYEKQRQRKIANKLLKLVRDRIVDFHPNYGSYLKRYSRVPSYNRGISVKTDYDMDDDNITYGSNERKFSPIVTDISTEEVNNINKLADWLPTDKKLTTTPLSERYKYLCYLNSKKCYSTVPIGDKFIYKDLQQVFKNVPSVTLVDLISYVESFPYYQFYKKRGKLAPKEERFKTQFKLTSKQLLLCYNIRTQIWNRASYGVLFLRDNQFFTVTNPYGNQSKGAVKGHSTLKSDETWEEPWETAVREVKEEIEYRSNKDQAWGPYDMKEHEQEFQHLNYVECLLEGYAKKRYTRLIGLFIIRLKTSIEFRPKDKREVLHCDWHPIEEEYDPLKFYTLDPFIKYVRQHYQK